MHSLIVSSGSLDCSGITITFTPHRIGNNTNTPSIFVTETTRISRTIQDNENYLYTPSKRNILRTLKNVQNIPCHQQLTL